VRAPILLKGGDGMKEYNPIPLAFPLPGETQAVATAAAARELAARKTKEKADQD